MHWLLIVLLTCLARAKHDPLCHANNTVNDTCTISAQTIRLKHNLMYKTHLNLVFNNTNVYCIDKKRNPCDISLNLTSAFSQLLMAGNSSISARQVVLEVNGMFVLNDTAQVNVTGLSRNTNGTAVRKSAGASFIGEAGTCSTQQKYRTYGSFDMVPHHLNLHKINSQIGSMGNRKQKITGGGGRIALKADSV